MALRGPVAAVAACALLFLGSTTARGETVDRDTARREARRILAEPRFNARPPPRPFRGVLRRLGEIVTKPLRALFRPLSRLLPAFGTLPWYALALVVVIVAGVVAHRLVRDRSRPRFAGAAKGGRQRLSAEALEEEADRAEGRGDLDAALRLRFQAGLLRLDRAGAVTHHPGLTNAAVARALRSGDFDALAVDFDEVAYGGRRATAGDLEEARGVWPRVVAEARGT